MVETDILKALHELFSPFDARWLTDCTTHKDCTFDGEERLHIDPREPIFLSSRILEVAIKNSTAPPKRVIASLLSLMDFIELRFDDKIQTLGPVLSKKVRIYHSSVRAYIKGKSLWSNSKKEETKEFEKNKILKVRCQTLWTAYFFYKIYKEIPNNNKSINSSEY